MFSKLQSGFSYANVMATIAVFLALGGGAYAAFALPKNSVGSKQIKKNAVTSSKVKNGSLLAGDFKAGQLPAGPRGPRGIQGAPGEPADTSAFLQAKCPAGTIFHEGVCIETTKRAAQTWADADTTCFNAQRRLPSVAELETLRFRGGTDMAVGGEWTSATSDYTNGTTASAYARSVGTISYGGAFYNARSSPTQFRCVATWP